MSVNTYSFGLLEFEDFDLRYESPDKVISILRAWRNHHETSVACSVCNQLLDFKCGRSRESNNNFAVCCGRFYYKPARCYVPESFAVRTPGYEFLLPCMKKTLEKKEKTFDQQFLVIPDPVYWQVLSTLCFEKALRFASGVPMTKKTPHVLPVSKTPHFYKQLQETTLNHGSLSRRSGGKNSFFRQLALGKRCESSARAMIVPDVDLRSNEIALPRRVAEQFGLEGRWVVLNRMPSLQPENFVALRVAKVWDADCFGIPLEILAQINGDFDGDECNLYIVRGSGAQAECEILLNSERNAGSPTLGLKLHPCQDALVAYGRLYETRSSKLDYFLPGGEPSPSLGETLKAAYDLGGSAAAFRCFEETKRLYLSEMRDEWMFGLSVEELASLERTAVLECDLDFERFSERLAAIPDEDRGCLLRQTVAGAKGNAYHLFLMVGSIGHRGQSSLWRGLTVEEAEPHALVSYAGFKTTGDIWKRGYDFYKNCFCLQGLCVDYQGRLVDGKRVIEKNALDACHHDDAIGRHAFRLLFERHFGGKKRKKQNETERRKKTK